MVARANYFRAVTVLMALLGAALVTVLMASGTALAEEKENGLIYYQRGSWVFNVNPATGFTSQGTFVSEGQTFDISPDRQDLVYTKCYFGGCYNSLYTFPLSGGDPDYDESEVPIANKSSSVEVVRHPRFSPDGNTIYFIGVHVVDPPEGVNDPTYDTGAIYSVPTEGGEATKIPINLVNDDGTIKGIYTFALSHDGSKFALGGDHGVFTVPVSGGDATRVSNDSCKGADSPNFSSDDQMIVYTSLIWSGENCSGTSHRTIYTTPANNDGTSAGKALFPEDATNAYPSYARYKSYPSYSPDGKSIAFGETQDSTNYLSTAPATGGSTTRITYCFSCYPLWVEKDPPPSTAVPQTHIDDHPWPGSYPYTFYFSSSDEEATFECRLDVGTWDTCTSPQDYYDDLSQGQHTFQVRATNSAGTDPTPASYTWTVDTIPPETSIDSGPSGTVDTDSATFKFSANESVYTFQCRLDSTSEGDWRDCSSPKTYTGLSNGSHTFQVRAIDNAFNFEDSPASRTWTIDRPPPDTTIEDPSEGHTFTNDPVRISFTSSQSGSTFECSMDGGEWSSCGSQKNGTWSYQDYPGLANEAHTFQVRATNSGGTDATPDSLNFTVDIIPVVPHITDTNPDSGDTDVSRTIKPTVTFDTYLKADTVTYRNVKLQVWNRKKKRWVTVSSTPSYDNKVITVSPTNTLGSQKKYRVVLNTNIKSATDKNLEQPFTFRFTTRR